MRYPPLLFFLVLSNISLGQPPDYTIDLNAISSTHGIEYGIHIEKKNSCAQILLSRRDSSSTQWEPRDRLLREKSEVLLKKRNKKKAFKPALILDSLRRKYTYYSRDSIIIEKGHPLLSLMDSVYLASDEELERKEKDRFVLHGISISVTISDGIGQRRIGVTSPNKENHPLIYNLITRVLAHYRSGNPKILRTRKETVY